MYIKRQKAKNINIIKDSVQGFLIGSQAPLDSIQNCVHVPTWTFFWEDISLILGMHPSLILGIYVTPGHCDLVKPPG